jgi:hypothetical protein
MTQQLVSDYSATPIEVFLTFPQFLDKCQSITQEIHGQPPPIMEFFRKNATPQVTEAISQGDDNPSGINSQISNQPKFFS